MEDVDILQMFIINVEEENKKMMNNNNNILKCYICEQYYDKHNLSDVNGFLFCNECLNDCLMELID